MDRTGCIVATANNGTMVAEGIGTVKVKVRNPKGRIVEMSIHRVLYIPECSENLLSEGQLDERGIEILTRNGTKSFKKNGKLVATATRQSKLYLLDTVEDWATEHAFQAKVPSRMSMEELWHR